MKLKFGILQGLRFNIVIGLYAMSLHFMDVIQDLLALQLEFLQSWTQHHIPMLHGNRPQLLMMCKIDSDGNDIADMPTLFEE